MTSSYFNQLWRHATATN